VTVGLVARRVWHTRLGLQVRSFDLAAEAFADAVGRMSADSLAGITEDWGRRIWAQRTVEAEPANQPVQRGERHVHRRVVEVQAISGQASLSTDDAMMQVRGEGWNEVKVVAVSKVQVRPAEAPQSAQPSRRDHDPLVERSQHSCQAGLWDADTMAKYQYAEGLRRGLDRCRKLSSVNDGALRIKRITATNFSHAKQIIDWRHASDHLWAVVNAVCGERTTQAKQWAAQHLDLLWIGQVTEIVTTLDGMGLEHARWPDLVREASEYFRSNQERMRYDVFREQALPIGSGTVESAANTVVHHRLKRPGRGWEHSSGQAMLATLSELHSGRFTKAWQRAFSRS
jgi:hypothetical protein